MVKGICKYCGQEKELINSHIIPKSLCRIDELGAMVAIDEKKKKFDHNPIHQNGLKEHLLCKECDNLLGELDNYGSKVFKQIIPKHTWDDVDGHPMCKLLPNEVDYWKLKKFLISVIWRASIASGTVCLGKYEDIALRMLKEELPDNPNFFVPLLYAMNTHTELDYCSALFGNKTLGKHLYIIHFPHYKVMLIPNAEHSRDPKQMEMFKKLFSPAFIIVQMFQITSIYDMPPMKIFAECKKNEGTKKN